MSDIYPNEGRGRGLQGILVALGLILGGGGEGLETGAAFAGDGSLMKTVRVVTTVQYYLEK